MALKTGRPEDLPEFAKPPVAETVFSLQFRAAPRFTAAHAGLLWQRFREDLPLLEEHPPLTPVYEKFEVPSPKPLEIEVADKPPVPRLWFLNKTKTELIQVQADRFIHNWRKVQDLEPYPRYEPIREKFREEVRVLEAFFQEEGLGRLLVNQCELTYVNHIERMSVWERHGQLDLVLRNWSRLPESAFLPESEDVALRLRFVIPDEEGRPIGRLNVALQPAWKRDNNDPIMRLTLTARGKPIEEGIDGAFEFFDLGRRWIVKGFTDLTTPEMWRAWERTDA